MAAFFDVLAAGLAADFAGDAPPGTGPLLRLTVHLPEGRKLFLTGRVVRSAEPGGFPRPAGSTGFGLRFADESPEYENLLNWLSDESK